MPKEKKSEEAPKKKKTSTNRISEYKLMQYNGFQMSRKMYKLWLSTK